eukprot:6198147-Pleurochrysis_carterae.AAC.2
MGFRTMLVQSTARGRRDFSILCTRRGKQMHCHVAMSPCPFSFVMSMEALVCTEPLASMARCACVCVPACICGRDCRAGSNI